MKRWSFISLSSLTLLVTLTLGLTQCKPEKAFKGEGIITNVSPSEISVNSLVPNPLRTNIRECNPTFITEQEVQCQERMFDMTYTHDIKLDSIDEKVKTNLQPGNVIKTRLPVLNSYTFEVNKQYVRINPHLTQVGVPVFLNGIYKDNNVKIKSVSELSLNKVSITNNTPNNSVISNEPVKVCVLNNSLNNNKQLTFMFFRGEGGKVIQYELMHPNVQVDKVNSGAILEQSDGITVLTMSPDLTVVEGYEISTNTFSCVNPEGTSVPPYRSKSVAAIGSNTTNYAKQSSNSFSWFSLRGLFVIIFTICIAMPLQMYLGIFD